MRGLPQPGVVREGKVSSARSQARPRGVKAGHCLFAVVRHRWCHLRSGSAVAPERLVALPVPSECQSPVVTQAVGQHGAEPPQRPWRLAARRRGPQAVREERHTLPLSPPLPPCPRLAHSVLLLLSGQRLPAWHWGHHSRVQAFLLCERG